MLAVDNLKIKKSLHLDSNIYFLFKNNEVIIIDCGLYPNMEKMLKNISVKYIFLTHEHYDHISGVNYFKKCFPNVKVICSKICAEALENPNKNLSRHFDAFCSLQTWIPMKTPIKPVNYSCKADYTFEKYGKIVWQNHIIEMFFTPGHSPGSSMYLIDKKILFSGDSIFKEYPTFTKLYRNGSKEFNDISLPIIKSFDCDAVVYPGHLSKFKLKEAFVFGGV